MVALKRLSGTWRGRLIDVQGFEGSLELSLKGGRDGRVSGSFNVEIGTHHSTLRRHGEVEGVASEKDLKLAFIAKEPPVKIGMEGRLLDLRDGGVGLQAVYSVSARGFSPLQGGVACVAKDQKVEVAVASRREWV